MRSKRSPSRLFGRVPGHRAGGLALLAAAGLVAALLAPVVSQSVHAVLGDARPATMPATTAVRPGLPVYFEPNQGQAGDGPRFVARGSGLGLALSPTEAHFSLGAGGGSSAPASLRLVGANSDATLVPADRQRATSSYFVGSDPAKWQRGLPTYGQVVSEGVYPGIDLAWHGHGPGATGLEYDFLVAPGADPGPIALTVGGAEALAIDSNGDLVATLAGGHTLRQHRPVAYQTGAGGRRTPVDAAFRLDGDEVRFDLGAYDPARRLVIDPVLAWSTYLGGETRDDGHSVDVDAAGNLYAMGETMSLQFPVTSGTMQHTPAPTTPDIFVTKWDAAGSLLYSAVVGGGSTETPRALASGGDALSVSADGFVHVVGSTLSLDFPTVNPQDACEDAVDPVNGWEAFAFKLDQAASTLVFSTCLGGNDLQEWGSGSAVDDAGNLYVTGVTRSKLYPVLNNAATGLNGVCVGHLGDPNVAEGQDIFLTKLSATGTMRYSTCWGGTASEQGNAVDVDAAGNAYVVGKTDSSSFPQKNNTGIQTGFGGGFEVGVVVKFAPGARPKFSTFLGYEGALQDVEVHNSKLYVAGADRDTGGYFASQWPAAAGGAYQTSASGGGIGDAFVARLRFEPGAPHVPVMDRFTFVGGDGRDYPLSMAVGGGGVWLAVDGESTIFPQVDPLMPACAAPGHIVARLSKPLTTLTFSSCLSGVSSPSTLNGERVSGVTVDGAGNAFVTGWTRSTSFPTTAGAYDTTCGTDGACGSTTTAARKQDAFVLKISPS